MLPGNIIFLIHLISYCFCERVGGFSVPLLLGLVQIIFLTNLIFKLLKIIFSRAYLGEVMYQPKLAEGSNESLA